MPQSLLILSGCIDIKHIIYIYTEQEQGRAARLFQWFSDN